MTVGERIKKQRELLGISQTELAKKVNISKQTLYKYETNVIINIPSDKIEEIAKMLYVSPSYLMGWYDTPNIIEILIKNLDKYFADHPIKFHSNVIFLNELNNIQSEELDDMLQDTIGLSIKELNSILDRKHIPTSKELANILNGLNISIEELLELPYPPSYHHAKYDFIRATLCENGYILTGLDENTLLLGIHGNAYEINVTAYDTFVSSIDDYISLNLKQLTLNGKRNPELDAALDSFLD